MSPDHGAGTMPATGSATAFAWINSAAAVRERCGMIHAAAEHGTLSHFVLDVSNLVPCADYVLDTIRANYPTLAIPYHSRWRHFAAGGYDRWAAFASSLEGSRKARARLRIELAIVSVLLDAGAGAHWSYHEARTGHRYARSEGLAVASFDFFLRGGVAGDGSSARADAPGLRGVSAAALAQAFQVSDANPLVGVEGRVLLLQSLGEVLLCHPEIFGSGKPRLGRLFDYLAAQAVDGQLRAETILQALTTLFAPIWPGRLSLEGVQLGDVWRHPAAITSPADPTSGLVPFHKLSQWLAYSLVEPFEEAGIAVIELDGLTGLPEYRNGGLLIDAGVLALRDPAAGARSHRPDDELVVEWRALTVILLDRIAALVRTRLGLDAQSLPLAKVLEGGTWAAGRRIAGERRADGGPPLRIDSDGTVF